MDISTILSAQMGDAAVQKLMVGDKVVWPVESQPQLPRHSIYGPANLGWGSFNDSKLIELADSFYFYPNNDMGWKVVGGRVYLPASVPDTEINVWLCATAYAEPMDFVTTPRLREATAQVTPGGWAEVEFDTPYVPESVQQCWIGYSLPSGTYMYVDDGVSAALRAYDGSPIYRAERYQAPHGDIRPRFRYEDGQGSGIGQPGSNYGIDIIIEETP